jgi:hypothetical protein
MALTAAQQARLDELDAILASGASSMTEDGRTVQWDLKAARLERDALRQQAAGVAVGSRFRRVVFGNG